MEYPLNTSTKAFHSFYVQFLYYMLLNTYTEEFKLNAEKSAPGT